MSNPKQASQKLTFTRTQILHEVVEDALIQIGPLKRKIDWTHKTHTMVFPILIKREGQVIVVPERYRRLCMREFHEDLGHPGQKRMVKTIGMRYYWQSIRQDVKEYVKKCHCCSSRKVYYAVAKPPIQAYDWPNRPFVRAHMDLTELNTSTRGYRYILAVKGALTKLIELVPLKDKLAETVISALVEWVVLGIRVILTLITDRGSENCNSIMADVVKALNCKHISTTPNNPRSDGLIENQMRTLKDQLAAWTNKFHNDWDLHLQKVAHGYRTTINDATGLTPFFMNHGRECNQPSEEHLLSLSEEEYHNKLEQYAEDLRATLLATWEVTSEKVGQNTETFNRVPREHLSFKPYEIGQFVFIKAIPKRFYSEVYKKKKHKLSSKLQYRYVGPYRIIRRLSEVLYEADIHNEVKRIHAVNMKPA